MPSKLKFTKLYLPALVRPVSISVHEPVGPPLNCNLKNVDINQEEEENGVNLIEISDPNDYKINNPIYFIRKW